VNDLASTFLLVYAGLFPIVNPVGSAPIFLSLTRHCPARERHAIAGRVAVHSFFLLLGSLLIGSYVLEFFGISVPALRIAGGLVVTSFGWRLLHSGGPGDDQLSAAAGSHPVDAFYPLTMPLTVGPGSISVAVTLGTQRPRPLPDIAHIALLIAAAVAGLLAIAATVYLCYRFADRVITLLGARGTDVLIRLSAFILLCIGIQILWTGVSSILGDANPVGR
jgi:multiple antibiotic resistance protein